MSDKTEPCCCANCVHAKRAFFVWFCTCPVVVNTKKDPVTGQHDWLNLTCRKVRRSMTCPYYEPRQFAPPIPEERRNPIPPLPPRSFVPPKETPMHKAPPMENEIDGCDSCMWHQPDVFNGLVMYHACKHEKSRREGRYNLQCIDMRSNEDFCGKEKRLYEPKDQAK